MQIDELLIDKGITALEAMRRLDEAGRCIVFIAPEGRLEAVLTDSDIRKYILRGGDLSRPVAEMANFKPKSLPLERRAEARSFLVSQHIGAVPLLDKNGCIVDIVFLDEDGGLASRKILSNPVVIMAGGLGTRLYPYTKILPKPLIPVGEVPIIERVIGKFHACGCGRFTLVVNYRKNMIKSYFADLEPAYTVDYAEEDTPLGTGGGLSLLKGRIDDTFFLTNCDILIDADYADILRFHQNQGNAVTMVCAMKEFVIPYGVVELGADGRLGNIAEKPKMNHLTNTGMYVVEPAVLGRVEDGTPQTFPEIIERCKAAGDRIGVYPISEAGWMDMGQMEELDEMRRRFERE